MRLLNRTVLKEKLNESIFSVLPITAIVFLLCFTVISVPTDLLMAFALGAVMLIFGMGLFTLGADLAMTPVGEHIGTAITKSRRIWIIVLISFVVGTIVTISEPDLQVLAEQVTNVPNFVIVGTVAAGVGIFLVIAIMRILFKIRLSHLLILFYGIIFIIAQFAPKQFVAIAFDAGGVTTGPMTVPFIIAMGVGIAAIRNDRDAENDSFGLVALCSTGPILAILILGLVFKPRSQGYTPVEIPDVATSRALWSAFQQGFPRFFKEVSAALLPIVVFFVIFQIASVRIPKGAFIRIVAGFVYTYIGLVLFLCGVNIGFMPVGNYIGRQLGESEYSWIVIPISMLIGFFIVAAEPAVHVLNKQVYEITSGAIPQKAMSTSLSVGVAVSAGLAMLRIVSGISIMYILLPGYLIAIILSFFVPPIFTAIAFDSGGVASGTMTATFMLPLAMGFCTAKGGDVLADAFGVIAMVATTPLIAVQVLGLVYKLKSKKTGLAEDDLKEVVESIEEIIELGDGE